jgi:glutamate/tyrosine decarboxylase-like PLP-dependent enzyme
MTSPRDPYRGASPEQEPIDLGSVFLGPKAENADVFEKLLLEAFRDHVFWRRNFHPEDGFEIREAEKHTPAYERSISALSQELMSLLGELKAGVPFFSPRYIGHMSGDLTMASQIGYFAAMLYNPNNVAAEASPVTSRLELEVAAQLAEMIGYDAERQWGHLTSGGTVANFEALWVARNLKYLPVAVRWAAEEMGESVRVRLPGGEVGEIGELDLWELLNLDSASALDAAESFRAQLGDSFRASQVVGHHSLAGLGYQEFGRRLAGEFGDALPPGVVLVPSTAHYSWEKICRALGIGGAQLVHVPVDARFRMDPAALEEMLHATAARRQAVVTCVSVIGTTEESAVDRLDLIHAVRERAARELGVSVYLHADAAWGGYAASITRAPGGERRPYSEALADYAPELWPEEGVYNALVALEHTDSVTIDPHKLGFVPYPAGAVSFRDRRVRDLVAVEAPYLFHGAESQEGAYIGRFILEGSKPGAAAVGVWMSHEVLPLDASGYGRLIGETARGALLLHRRISGGDWGAFRVVPLPRPDINIVCFALGHPDLRTLEETNDFVDRVYHAMSVGPHRSVRQLDYFVTKTTLRPGEYGRSALPFVEALGFTEDDYRAADGLSVIRCTVMDPFLAQRRGRADHIDGFADALRAVLEAEVVSG